jgi:Flp pilus assembly pilin Flp
MNINGSARPRDDAGASAAEYAILMSLIAAVILLAVGLLGTTTGGLFERPCAEANAAGVPC